MDNAVFVLEEGTKNWRYKDFIVREIEDHKWQINYRDVFQVYESSYDVVAYIYKHFNLNPVFRIPDYPEDLPSSCSS